MMKGKNVPLRGIADSTKNESAPAACITVNGGAPPQIGLILELYMDLAGGAPVVVPNDMWPPPLPPLNHGPLSIAPNNGQLSKQTQCAEQALKKNGVALGLDAAGIGAGFLPGGDLVVAGAQVGIGVASTVNSAVGGDATGSMTAIFGFQLSAMEPAAKWAGMGARAIPFLGTALSVASTVRDVAVAYGDYQSCMAGD